MTDRAQARPRRIVVVGATSAIAEHCCRLWVSEAPTELILVARDLARAGRIAADLRRRAPGSTVSVMKGDFHDPLAIDALVRSIADYGPIDMALIAQGWLADQQSCRSGRSP